MQQDQLPSTRYMRQSQILPDIVPIGKSTLWRWVRAGRFPEPVKIGANITAWRVEDVREWIAKKEGKEAVH